MTINAQSNRYHHFHIGSNCTCFGQFIDGRHDYYFKKHSVQKTIDSLRNKFILVFDKYLTSTNIKP